MRILKIQLQNKKYVYTNLKAVSKAVLSVFSQ
jgi:hypothetical protein